MHIKELSNFPENSNPFHHDAYRMGTSIDGKWIVMFDKHKDNEYVIVVNTTTGERVRLSEVQNPVTLGSWN